MNIEIVDEQSGSDGAETAGDGDDPLSPTSPDPAATDPARLLRFADMTMKGERLPEDTEVTITLIDVPAMTDLNERHMGGSGATDVLSFPIEDMTPGVPWEAQPGGPPLVIGDVFICPEVVLGNASAAEVPFGSEMALMVVHGLLHLLGYDHIDDADAELMEFRERMHLAKVGVSRP